MTDSPIVVQLPLWPLAQRPPKKPQKQQSLSTLAQHPQPLPASVHNCPAARSVLDLLAPLNWDGVPERNPTFDRGLATIPLTALVAASLIKLNESRRSTAGCARL